MLNVQGPWLAVLSDPAPIPETVGEIAGLLDFIAADAGTQGMNGSGRNIKHVSRMHFRPAEAAFQPALIQHRTQGFAMGVYAVDQLRSGRGVQDIPGFAFAGFPFVGEGIAVIRMNLDGQGLTGVQP